MPTTTAIILDEIIRSADQAFRMMMGLSTIHCSVNPAPTELFTCQWDYTGTIQTSGEAAICVGSGLSNMEMDSLGQLMVGERVTDEELLQGCLQELLNVILGGPVGVICKYFSVKLGFPMIKKNSPILQPEEFPESYLLSFQTECINLFFIVGFKTPEKTNEEEMEKSLSKGRNHPSPGLEINSLACGSY